jgi:nucleotide-binding universal stress UspA family protein
MFNRILVPLDGSAVAECVLPHVAAWSRLAGETVILLRVIEQPPTSDQIQSVDPVNWRLQQVEAKTYLEDIKNQLEEAGLSRSVETVVLEGKPAERIIAYTREREIDLVILSSHGRGGLSGWNISSTVQKVMVRVYTSILIVRAYQSDQQTGLSDFGYGRVVVPLDGSIRAEYVLPVITPLSQEYQAECLLVHVVAQPEMPGQIPLTPEERQMIDKLVEHNRQEIMKYFEQLKKRLPGNVQTRVIANNSVIATLHSLIEDEKADLVLLSAHGHSGKTKHPYGSVSTSFVIYGTTPLLIIQDIPQEDVELSLAEFTHHQNGMGNGGRTTITYDKPSI